MVQQAEEHPYLKMVCSLETLGFDVQLETSSQEPEVVMPFLQVVVKNL